MHSRALFGGDKRKDIKMPEQKQPHKLTGNKNAVKDNLRTVKITVRFTVDEYATMCREARYEQRTVADFIRYMTLPQ